MLLYRFDVPNQKFYYRTEGSKKTCVEFSEMFELICMLANDTSLYENLMQHSEKGFHARKNWMLSEYSSGIIPFIQKTKKRGDL